MDRVLSLEYRHVNDLSFSYLVDCLSSVMVIMENRLRFLSMQFLSSQADISSCPLCVGGNRGSFTARVRVWVDTPWFQVSATVAM
jgi:hypothetical protein